MVLRYTNANAVQRLIASGAIRAAKRRLVGQHQKYAQEFLTIPNSVCDIAINPQPRKPNHAIIVDTIIAARK
jgi:hypothetical protein